MLIVLASIAVGNRAMVFELTPATEFTVGKAAVPPKSPANWILPFNNEVASGVELELILLSKYVLTAFAEGYLLSDDASRVISRDLFALSSFKSKAACVEDKIEDFTLDTTPCTNSVLAIWIELSVKLAVVVVGVPFKIGDVKVLFVKTSTPSKVAIVPMFGKVILLAPVVVMVKSPVPCTVRLWFNLIVFPTGLATPVPPRSLFNISDNW